MQIHIKFFGHLTDITNTNQISLNDVDDTNSMIYKLVQKFPLLKESKYIIAVDKKVIFENTNLNNNCTVALLPPYSGG